MMLWWKYQQLRSSNLKTRLTTVAQLAENNKAESVGPLLFALKDQHKEVRAAAALALGQVPDKQLAGPLIKLLEDSAPLVRTAAAEALAQLQNPEAIPPLIQLLRDADPAVRARTSHTLEKLGWQPENETERTWHIVATGNLKRVSELGSDGVDLLTDLLRNGTPDKQLFAVKALGEIEDARVPKLLLEALGFNNTLVRLAALDLLADLADPANYEVMEKLLKDKEPNIRAAAIGASVSCGGSRAVPALISLLKDTSWEVRREAIRALGKIGDSAAIDALARALQDRDHDVRESAALALGRIGDPQGIRPLVLALLDIESFVRSAAASSLKDIDPHWEKTAAARSALPQIKAARKHREYWISHSAGELLKRIPDDGAEPDVATSVSAIAPPSRHTAGPPDFPPPERVAPVEIPPARRADQLFGILSDMLGDDDRDLRLAATAVFSQLREKRATQLLSSALHDGDPLVRAAAERAILSLN